MPVCDMAVYGRMVFAATDEFEYKTFLLFVCYVCVCLNYTK